MMQAFGKGSLWFATVLALGALAGAAEARQVHYEINGTAYTYNTKSRVQVEFARRRIEAANRVDEIKARAAAEAASNLFVRLFGSPTQAEVPAAEAELQKVLAEPEPSRGEANAIERQVRRELRIERRRMAVIESRAKKRQQMADLASPPKRAATTSRRSHIAAVTGSRPQDPVVTPGQVAEPVDPQAHMMGFVEQLRGKNSNDPISRRLRQP